MDFETLALINIATLFYQKIRSERHFNSFLFTWFIFF